MSTTLFQSDVSAAAELINGIDTATLRKTIDQVRKDSAVAQTRFAVTTDWLGGTVSRTRVAGCEISGKWIDRPFELRLVHLRTALDVLLLGLVVELIPGPAAIELPSAT